MAVSFSSLLQSKAFSDLCLVANGTRISIHRAIVAERSGYFHDLFAKDPSQKIVEITLPDPCSECLPHVLNFLYSDPNFHVTKNSFGPILNIAVCFKIQALIDTLFEWMKANITAENTMYFYFAIKDIQDKLKAENDTQDKSKADADTQKQYIQKQLEETFMTTIIDNIVLHFELIDRGDIWSLPYNTFYTVITHKNFNSSSFCLSSAIAYTIMNNSKLEKSEVETLLSLYLQIDWPASITELVQNSAPNDPRNQNSISSLLLPFVAKHFRRIPNTEFSKFPHKFMTALVSRDDLNAPSSEYVRQQIQNLTNSTTRVNKQRNLQMWEAFLGDGKEREYHTLPVTKENIRVLILSSVYLDVLTDIKQDLVEGGIQAQNIFLFNADTGHPTSTLLFQFDVVLAFTHYQFENPDITCSFLYDYVQNGGGLVTCYGFCRDDEWGLGDEALDSLMPFARGTQLTKCAREKVIVEDNHPLMDGIKTIRHGEFSPRCNVKLNEGATLVASFADGVPLVAYKETNRMNQKIVSINFYPVSSRVHRLGFPPDQPWTQIFTRAILYACGIDISNKPEEASGDEDPAPAD
ncbi:BTB/POZ domain containing protein [Trichomonas vaginalis G3]|uniref:BTB/POZ domain containing protein n=1 Tax=Trichomonas vaginalis (strain ATCC PRA-98 / G3) TaxID=412133 RepID=A2DPE8_TRIV3|nr:Potassium Channel Kv1.1, Chain A domain-containing protein [Trichomonas vaginalis G3]EAY17692.1 BTB/POZ domain containing protein [Trichomonas vaginalis G3]KAI5507904.1 Potassium Channel Kv1.1, Chain A domain-containing protein [Trichomonas vaginalis G3]|eukprot:XP_001329827.1 BTB/POZ domain containing protein [Trichomonas vaginalis G3]